MIYSFVRYLEAKKTVDDRALNHHVWQTLRAALPSGPLTILEAGAGIGTMIGRLSEWDIFSGSRYIAIDSDPENIRTATQRLADNPPPFTVEMETADVLDYLVDDSRKGKVDLLIAHAFLDLLDISTALPVLFSAMAPGGHFYFTLNFDGVTVFEPVIDRAFDEQVLALYHRTMDERLVNGRPSGDSRSGRHLLQEIPAAGGEILAAGSSDWIVFPQDGRYQGGEAYFLHHILHFVETSLTGHAELDPKRLANWLARRHAQVDAGELIYIAHQLDVAGRV
ncbi:MAG: class I SAM-dependent methyltransferase [Chloroflexota bacterium]